VSYAAKGDSFTAGKAQVWSQAPLALVALPGWDLAPDGKRMAVVSHAARRAQRRPRS
jgi:hypothetical protein